MRMQPDLRQIGVLRDRFGLKAIGCEPIGDEAWNASKSQMPGLIWPLAPHMPERVEVVSAIVICSMTPGIGLVT
jgi:hypothetical protein